MHTPNDYRVSPPYPITLRLESKMQGCLLHHAWQELFALFVKRINKETLCRNGLA